MLFREGYPPSPPPPYIQLCVSTGVRRGDEGVRGVDLRHERVQFQRRRRVRHGLPPRMEADSRTGLIFKLSMLRYGSIELLIH